LTANRTQILQDINSPTAVVQNVIDNSADKSSYYFSGNTSSVISCGDSDQFSFGNQTNDSAFSILTVAKILSSTVTDQTFCAKYWADSTSEYMFAYNMTGVPSYQNKLQFTLRQSWTTPKYSAYILVPYTIDNGSHALVATYDGRGGSTASSGMKIFVDGILQSSTGATSSSYVAMGNGSDPLTIGRLGGADNSLVGNIFRNIIFNYDISLYSNKISRYSSGAKLDYDDIGGSNSALIAGYVLVIGKRYRILARNTLDFTTMGAANNNVGTEFVSTGTGTLAGTDSVIRLGAVLDLEPEGIGEGTWADSSTNKLNGTVNNVTATFPSQNDYTSTWTPGGTATANMTITTPAATNAKYRVNNGICYFEFKLTAATLSFTSGDTLSEFTFTLPVSTRTNTGYINGGALAVGASAKDYGLIFDNTSGDATTATVSIYNRKIGAAAITYILISGWYYI
jgi:hypothetical protein